MDDLAIETFRSLAQLEGEMKKAERAYLEADARLAEADAALRDAEQKFEGAQRRRQTALAQLDECHSDIDRTLAALRDASPAACQWKIRADHAHQALLTEGEPTFKNRAEFILKN